MGIDVPALLALVFAAFALIQIFYVLWFFLRLAIYKQKPAENESLPPVSLIICAKNEEDNLKQRAEAWITQDYFSVDGSHNFEVLIVDDNSEDGSAFFYNELREKYPKHVRILQLRQEAKGIKGKKFPLSMGIKEAKYEHLLLTDADCTPASDQWLKIMAARYDNASTHVVLGYSGFTRVEGFLNKWIRWETLHTAIQYFSYALAGKPYMGVGRNLSYKRSNFLANKGFGSHSQLISGDDDLFINEIANSSNTRICIDKDAFTTSMPKTNYDAWWYQKSRHVSTARMYKTEHRFLLGLYSFSHSMFWLLFIPALFCSFLWPITLGMFVARILLHWIVVSICAAKLNEKDLMASIPLFDFLTLYYNIRLLPQLFRSPDLWK
ncbi:MAG: hypothetical protein RL660_1484 [Bacteroidota bacterium]|jgi:glycosyltransferase involved in cell wall biosynthesis